MLLVRSRRSFQLSCTAILPALVVPTRDMRKKATPTPRKAKLDRQRDTTIQRYRRLIQVAVRQDDEVATERWVKEATKAGVTKIVVDKVLQRSRNRGALDEMTYEGTLPGGVAIIVEALTDNKSRTAQDVRHLLSEGGGTLGASGSALWAFERCGLLELSTTDEAQRDALLDFAMGLEGIENVVEKEAVEGSGSTGIGVEVWVAPKELSSLRAALTTEGHHPFNEQLLYKPVSPMGSLEAEVRADVLDVVSKLLTLDDVEEVWHNLDADEADADK